MKRSVLVLALVLFSTGLSLAQTTRPKTPVHKPVTAEQKASQPKFKAIFEPVNYKEDLSLFDVFFVSKEEGWVSGAAGYHTSYQRWRQQLDGGTGRRSACPRRGAQAFIFH